MEGPLTADELENMAPAERTARFSAGIVDDPSSVNDPRLQAFLDRGRAETLAMLESPRG